MGNDLSGYSTDSMDSVLQDHVTEWRSAVNIAKELIGSVKCNESDSKKVKELYSKMLEDVEELLNAEKPLGKIIDQIELVNSNGAEIDAHLREAFDPNKIVSINQFVFQQLAKVQENYAELVAERGEIKH